MSLEQQPNPSAPAPSPSFIRLFRFPLIVILIFGCLFATPFVSHALGIEPERLAFFIFFAFYLGPILAVLLIILWWLFAFRGLGFLSRLGVFVLVAGSLVAAAVLGTPLVVRNLEFTVSPVGLVPRLHFVWDRSAEEELRKEREEEADKAAALPAINAAVGAQDFPAYRGARTDGVVAFAKPGVATPEVLWRKACPGGYSGVAVAGKIVMTLQQRVADKKEVVVCYDRDTGIQRWEYAYNAYHKDVMGDGPRSTPTIHDGRIFTTGATGELVCLTAEGKLVWSKNILEIAQAKNIKWGMTGSPLIVDDLVIANPGIDPDKKESSNSSLIAFELATGKIRWQAGNRPAGYSSPQLATLGSVRQIILFDGAGLAGCDIKTGKELWAHPWVTAFDMNSIQPVVLNGDRVLISSEIDNGCAMLRIKAPNSDKSAWSVDVVWQNKNLAARYANPVSDGKQIFGLHNMAGVLVSLDAETGKVRWKGDRFGPGQLLLADGVLLVVNGDTGDVSLVELDGTELARHPVLQKRDKTWNTPALAGDQLFIRNQAEIVCMKMPTK